jgi:hypothetical protein
MEAKDLYLHVYSSAGHRRENYGIISAQLWHQSELPSVITAHPPINRGIKGLIRRLYECIAELDSQIRHVQIKRNCRLADETDE